MSSSDPRDDVAIFWDIGWPLLPRTTQTDPWKDTLSTLSSIRSTILESDKPNGSMIFPRGRRIALFKGFIEKAQLSREEEGVLREVQGRGVSVQVCVRDGAKESLGHAITLEVMKNCVLNRQAPMTVVFVVGDRSYEYTAKRLLERGYHVIVLVKRDGVLVEKALYDPEQEVLWPTTNVPPDVYWRARVTGRKRKRTAKGDVERDKDEDAMEVDGEEEEEEEGPAPKRVKRDMRWLTLVEEHQSFNQKLAEVEASVRELQAEVGRQRDQEMMDLRPDQQVGARKRPAHGSEAVAAEGTKGRNHHQKPPTKVDRMQGVQSTAYDQLKLALRLEKQKQQAHERQKKHEQRVERRKAQEKREREKREKRELQRLQTEQKTMQRKEAKKQNKKKKKKAPQIEVGKSKKNRKKGKKKGKATSSHTTNPNHQASSGQTLTKNQRKRARRREKKLAATS